MTEKSIASFGDVQAVMEKAASAPKGIRYRLDSYGQAVNFRQRCYRFRKAQYNLAKERMGFVPGIPVSTPYDSLEITIVDNEGNRVLSRPKVMKPPYDIVLKHRELSGQILDLDGEALPPTGEGLEID